MNNFKNRSRSITSNDETEQECGIIIIITPIDNIAIVDVILIDIITGIIDITSYTVIVIINGIIRALSIIKGFIAYLLHSAKRQCLRCKIRDGSRS